MRKRHLLVIMGMILLGTASIASLALAQDAHTQHGAHAAAPTEKLFKAQLTVPDEIRQGQSFPLTIHIQDSKGKSVSVFDVFQEKLMHLILVSDDLGFFSHLHPEHKGKGVFLIETSLPSAGRYTLFADYKPAGQQEQVSVLNASVKGAAKASGMTDTGKTETILEDLKVSVRFFPKAVKANKEIILTFDVKQASDSSPAKGFLPYLGEKGHLVIIKKSESLTAKDYIHAHALKEGEASEIQFAARFPEAGLYKLWCQFNHRGRILTADFWIQVDAE